MVGGVSGGDAPSTSGGREVAWATVKQQTMTGGGAAGEGATEYLKSFFKVCLHKSI